MPLCHCELNRTNTFFFIYNRYQILINSACVDGLRFFYQFTLYVINGFDDTGMKAWHELGIIPILTAVLIDAIFFYD